MSRFESISSSLGVEVVGVESGRSAKTVSKGNSGETEKTPWRVFVDHLLEDFTGGFFISREKTLSH